MTVALVLVLLGAFTKSAQVPFHPWLPAAMAAPTPVSAYLHAASMVKAGVYLVFRLAPGLRRRARLAAAGDHGGPRHDGRRRLPGAAPDRPQAAARLRHRQPARVPRPCSPGRAPGRRRWPRRRVLLAHGLFKSALFLTVGVIDHQTGTRDLRRLSGLGAPDALAGGGRRCSPPRRWPGCRRWSASSPRRAAYEAFAHGGPGGAAHPRRAGASARCSPSPTRPGSPGARSPPSPSAAGSRARPAAGTARGRAWSFTAVPVTLGALGPAARARARSWSTRWSSAVAAALPGRGAGPPRAVARPDPDARARRRHHRRRAAAAPRPGPGGPRPGRRRAAAAGPPRRRTAPTPAPSRAPTGVACCTTGVAQSGSLPVYLGGHRR